MAFGQTGMMIAVKMQIPIVFEDWETKRLSFWSFWGAEGEKCERGL